MKTLTKPKRVVKPLISDYRPERGGCGGIPCPRCGAFSPEKWRSFTKDEIAGPMNCGRPYACCITCWRCPKCKREILAKQQAPEAW